MARRTCGLAILQHIFPGALMHLGRVLCAAGAVSLALGSWTRARRVLSAMFVFGRREEKNSCGRKAHPEGPHGQRLADSIMNGVALLSVPALLFWGMSSLWLCVPPKSKVNIIHMRIVHQQGCTQNWTHSVLMLLFWVRLCLHQCLLQMGMLACTGRSSALCYRLICLVELILYGSIFLDSFCLV